MIVWKGKAAVDGETHLVSNFDTEMITGTGRTSIEMGLCGMRPKDKGPMLSASGRVSCRGCKKMYARQVGREWKEPPQ